MKALVAIRQVINPVVGDDHQLEDFLVERAYTMGVPINDMRGKNREELIRVILKLSPSACKECTNLRIIAQTVAILGEGMRISRELANTAKQATGVDQPDLFPAEKELRHD